MLTPTHPKPRFLAVLVWLLAMLAVGSVSAEPSPVTDRHLQDINAAMQRQGVVNGYAGLDAWGRVSLNGEYQDERQVDTAFSLAQTVVGVRWVSPVTP